MLKTFEIDISFGRDYLSGHFGLKYEQDYFEDICVRAETDLKAKRVLYERFGDIGLGEAHPSPLAQLGYDDTLNVTLMFGGKLCLDGGISWVEPGFLDVIAVELLECPVIEQAWPHTQFLQQYEQAVKEFGPLNVHPPRPHGILEQAMDLRGDAFLVDLLTAPQRAAHLLDVLTEATISVKEFWDRKCYGEVRKGLSLGGCSTTMLSPELVAEFLVPRYERIAAHFDDAFICSCGVATQQLENWACIRGVRYVRCGWGSDLEKAAHLLRHRHVKAALDVVRVTELSPGEIEKDVLHILKTLEAVAHVSLLLINASAKTPDENVRKIVQTVRAFAAKNVVILNNSETCKPSVCTKS